MWWLNGEREAASGADGGLTGTTGSAQREIVHLHRKVALQESLAEQRREQMLRVPPLIERMKEKHQHAIVSSTIEHSLELADLIAVTASIEESLTRAETLLERKDHELALTLEAYDQLEEEKQIAEQDHSVEVRVLIEQLEKAIGGQQDRDLMIRRLQSQIGQIESEHVETQRQRDEEHQAIVDELDRKYKSQVATLVQSLHASRKQAEQRQSDLDAADRELGAIADVHAQDVESMLADHQEQVRRLTSAGKLLEQRLAEQDDLREAYEREREQALQHEQALAQAAEEAKAQIYEVVRDHQLQIEDERAASEGLKEQLAVALAEADSTRCNADDAQRQLIQRQATIEMLESKLNSQAESHRLDCEELARRGEERVAAMEASRSEEASRLREEAQRLQHETHCEAEHVRQEKDALSQQLGLLQKKCDSQTDQIADLLHKHIANKGQFVVRQKAEEANSAKQQASLEKRDEMIRQLRDELQSANDEATQREDEHRRETQEASDAAEVVQRRFADLVKSQDATTGQLARTRREAQQLRSDLKQQTKAHETELRQLQLLNDEREQRCEQLRSELERASVIARRCEASSDEAHRRSEQLLQMHKTLRTTLHERLHDEIDRRASADVQLDAAQTERDTLRGQVKHLRLRVTELSNEVETLLSVDDSVQSKIVHLNTVRDVATLRDRLRKEAVARRKAQSALRKQVGGRDQSAKEAWLEIATEEQVERLTRQLEAVEAMRLIEQRQAVDQIHQHQARIDNLENRRAA